MDEGLLIEYVGGPEDGRQAVLKFKGRKATTVYPLEIKFLVQEQDEEHLVGRYLRDHENANGAMRYLWAFPERHEASVDGG